MELKLIAINKIMNYKIFRYSQTTPPWTSENLRSIKTAITNALSFWLDVVVKLVAYQWKYE